MIESAFYKYDCYGGKMKKQLKFVSIFLIITCCFFLGYSDASAAGISPRAIRYEFNADLPTLGGSYEQVQFPLDDSGVLPTKFRYIRVRLEAGSGHGDKIDVYAIGSSGYDRTKIGALKSLNFSGDRQYVIDFKAPNAPTRSDADYTINCSQPSNYSGYLTDQNYCVANASGYYGVRFENYSLFGGTARVVGAFSFEN